MVCAGNTVVHKNDCLYHHFIYAFVWLAKKGLTHVHGQVVYGIDFLCMVAVFGFAGPHLIGYLLS